MMVVYRKHYMAGQYKSADKLSYVIANDYRLLQVMSRFGISLGFGEKTIMEVCRQCGVDNHQLCEGWGRESSAACGTGEGGFRVGLLEALPLVFSRLSLPEHTFSFVECHRLFCAERNRLLGAEVL